jgi:hypothetical protein
LTLSPVASNSSSPTSTAHPPHNTRPTATIPPNLRLLPNLLKCKSNSFLSSHASDPRSHKSHTSSHAYKPSQPCIHAGEFQGTLEGLEEEQRKTREALSELDIAVGAVENSLEDNRGVVRGNVHGLEGRVDALLGRLEDVSRSVES